MSVVYCYPDQNRLDGLRCRERLRKGGLCVALEVTLVKDDVILDYKKCDSVTSLEKVIETDFSDFIDGN